MLLVFLLVRVPYCAYARSFIVWKLACYERAFPAMFASRRALCVERVMDELLLRYEREHNRCD